MLTVMLMSWIVSSGVEVEVCMVGESCIVGELGGSAVFDRSIVRGRSSVFESGVVGKWVMLGRSSVVGESRTGEDVVWGSMINPEGDPLRGCSSFAVLMASCTSLNKVKSIN